eukprot:356130-Chlamydomonas_euryale.AAC.2
MLRRPCPRQRLHERATPSHASRNHASVLVLARRAAPPAAAPNIRPPRIRGPPRRAAVKTNAAARRQPVRASEGARPPRLTA